MADGRRPRPLALAAAALAGCAVLAACSSGSAPSPSPSASALPTGPNGVEKLTATQILDQSRSAAKAASWVHLSGTQNGTTLDLGIGHGTATGTIAQDGLTAQVLAVDGTTYVKGDKAFWESATGGTSGDVLAGKWVVAGSAPGSDLSGVQTFTDIDRVLDSVLTPTGEVTKGPVSTVAGQRVVALTEASDSSTLYVALDGPPYPVQIQPAEPTTDPPTFSQWNQPVTVTPPPPDQVVDPSKLGG